MDIASQQRRLGMTANLQKVSTKAKDLMRLCTLRCEGGLGVGEVCKSMVCLELACTSLQMDFDRTRAIKCSGADEKMYNQTLLRVQNMLDIRPKLNAQELCTRFGCIRLVDAVQRAVADYRTRFIAGLPEVRKQSASFSRRVFLGAALFLAAKKRKIKVDRPKLIQACGTSEEEFSNVTTSMNDLCFDTLGVEKKKRAAQEIKSNRALLDALPEKRARLACDSDDEVGRDALSADCAMVPRTAKQEAAQRKQQEYEEWRRKALALGNNKVEAARLSNTGETAGRPAMKQASLFGGFISTVR